MSRAVALSCLDTTDAWDMARRLSGTDHPRELRRVAGGSPATRATDEQGLSSRRRGDLRSRSELRRRYGTRLPLIDLGNIRQPGNADPRFAHGLLSDSDSCAPK